MRPETDNYGYLAIEALLDSGSFQEAWERAARIAVGAKASATLLYKVADVLYIGAHRCDPGFQPRLYERVIEVVDKASRLPQPSVTSVQVAGLVKKGFALANLGDLDKAEATLTEALKGDNNNDILLSARGLVRIESGRTSEALLDLMRAVDKGTVQSWPFVYVAQHAIQNGEFTRALDLVEEALRRTNDPRLQANLVEWRAIVLSGLGRMDEAVQFASEAETIEPFNERIAQNLQLIRSAQPYHRLQLQVDYSPAEMRLAG
jgi:tetratricopeptide (TPR) repeat protein